MPQPSWTDPSHRVPQLSGSWTYSTYNLQSAPLLGGPGHTRMVVGLGLKKGDREIETLSDDQKEREGRRGRA